MQLYAAFAMMQFRPPIYRQAQGYRRGIEGIHPVGDEEVLDVVTLLARQFYHTVCKLLEDTNLTCLVSLAQVAPRDTLAEAEVMESELERGERNDEVTQALTVRQLSEQQNQQMVPTGKTLDILVAVIF